MVLDPLIILRSFRISGAHRARILAATGLTPFRRASVISSLVPYSRTTLARPMLPGEMPYSSLSSFTPLLWERLCPAASSAFSARFDALFTQHLLFCLYLVHFQKGTAIWPT